MFEYLIALVVGMVLMGSIWFLFCCRPKAPREPVWHNAWVVERGSPCAPEYLHVNQWDFYWDKSSPRTALQFCRKEDAQALAACVSDLYCDPPTRVVLHQWDTPS